MMDLVVTVVGLGYVGLPLASEICRTKSKVYGFDLSDDVIQGLESGKSHIDDLSDEEVAAMYSNGFEATTSTECISLSDVVVICVPTPLMNDGSPNMEMIMEASQTVASCMKPSSLVILESTTYPGTTDGTVLNLLEERSGLKAGSEFSLAYSPERIDPGNSDFGIRNTPKIVAGYTQNCKERVESFYSEFIETVIPVSGLKEAEMAKLLENTYRHINIALVNEMAIFCHELDIDLWEVIRAAKTKPFGFEAFYPGPGVGGHCIPIDPNYLSWLVQSLGYEFRFVELAKEISNNMPDYVASRIKESLEKENKTVAGANILILGVSYKTNSSDQRETPARPLAEALIESGANLKFFDPFVASFNVGKERFETIESLDGISDWADLFVLLQPHSGIIDNRHLDTAKKIFDTRGVLTGKNVEKL